jgi:arylsulfatase A-like enzyme
MDLLMQLGIDNNTLVIFSSDNGPTYAGGADSDFFESGYPLRGLKGSVYEGGIRVPMVARWPGRIKPGTVSDHISGFQDYLPTFADIAGIEAPKSIDGISLLPELTGSRNEQKKHDYLYWEHIGRLQAVRMGKWKAVRHAPDKPVELYDLDEDVGELKDLSALHPDIVEKVETIMREGRIPSKYFPLKGVDPPKPKAKEGMS